MILEVVFMPYPHLIKFMCAVVFQTLAIDLTGLNLRRCGMPMEFTRTKRTMLYL